MDVTAGQIYHGLQMQTIARSQNCALNGRLRDRAIKCALACWPISNEAVEELPISRQELAAQVKAYYQQVYGNPLLMMILSIVIKLVLELLIEWWKNRDNRSAVLEAAAICHAAGMGLDNCFQ